jgi:SAM-dependent methyltransferase
VFHWFESRADFDAFTRHLEPMRSLVEKSLEEVDAQTGYCAACQAISRFSVRPGLPANALKRRIALLVGPRRPAGQWLNLRESLICPSCRLNGRMRALYIALQEELAARNGPPSLVLFERLTPLFAKVAAAFPFAEGCEYVDAQAAGGSLHTLHGVPVRHEDMLRLSWPDGRWTVLLHGDVLEHVPDHRQALAECCRVLEPGGTMIFSCPFFSNLDAHLVRCTLENGRLVHHHPPVYHGNPVSPKGSLVFTMHGWPLLEEVRAAGFRKAAIGLLYDPFQGILSSNNPYPEGFMWPVLFRAVK